MGHELFFSSKFKPRGYYISASSFQKTVNGKFGKDRYIIRWVFKEDKLIRYWSKLVFPSLQIIRIYKRKLVDFRYLYRNLTIHVLNNHFRWFWKIIYIHTSVYLTLTFIKKISHAGILGSVEIVARRNHVYFVIDVRYLNCSSLSFSHISLNHHLASHHTL